MIKLTLI
jgi:hypothetical protein